MLWWSLCCVVLCGIVVCWRVCVWCCVFTVCVCVCGVCVCVYLFDINRRPLHTPSVKSTPTNTARTELRSIITYHHANTRGSRAGRVMTAHLCVLEIIFHPRVMSRSLPHLTLTTWTSSLSPLSATSLSFRQSHTRPVVLDPFLPCDVPRQGGGSTQIPSLAPSARPLHFFSKSFLFLASSSSYSVVTSRLSPCLFPCVSLCVGAGVCVHAGVRACVGSACFRCVCCTLCAHVSSSFLFAPQLCRLACLTCWFLGSQRTCICLSPDLVCFRNA